MGSGDYWRNTDSVEKPLALPTDSDTNYKNLISLLIRLVKEQKSIIEQQQSDIEEMKTTMNEVKLKFDVLLRIDAYQADE